MERLAVSSRKLDISMGTLHARMGTIKERNGKDLTEAEEIKKRWQAYTHTQKLYQKKKKGLK